MATLPAVSPSSLSPVAFAARWVFFALAVLFGAGVVLQVFSAGLAALVAPTFWPLHVRSGHLVGVSALLLLAVAPFGRLSGRMLRLTVALFALFACQYLFLRLADGIGIAGVRALHAVNALSLFWIAASLVPRAWRLVRDR